MRSAPIQLITDGRLIAEAMINEDEWEEYNYLDYYCTEEEQECIEAHGIEITNKLKALFNLE